MNYSIGEFSRITCATVKALRLYHEKGLLAPDFIDPESGYRYYAADQIQDAKVIQALKRMGFSLSEIKEVLDECEDDSDLLGALQRKRNDLETRVRSYRRSIEEIELILKMEEGNAMKHEDEFEVEEKLLPDLLVAGIRKHGRYGEVDQEFRLLGRFAGRHSTGTAMCLYYDGEYKEEGADFEVCMAVKKDVVHEEIQSHTLEGGRALTIMHRGPYSRLGDSYAKLFAAVKEAGVEIVVPSREIYHKGPGMIFRGNPEKYLTEIQFLLKQ